ncbi:hypothetical protein JCM33374_g2438 [Metschnikowia sp. JCM 33374]|nr:hypothetical protein JCM33374_g2438 [Metschnikowia sp. JCM 33374]
MKFLSVLAFSALAFATSNIRKGTLSIIKGPFSDKGIPISVIDGRLVANQGTTYFEHDQKLQTLKHMDSGTYLNINGQGKFLFLNEPLQGFRLVSKGLINPVLQLDFQGTDVFELCANNVLGYDSSCATVGDTRHVRIKFTHTPEE